MKFLAKDELSNFKFQSEFLKPLEVVLVTPNSNIEAKQFVISIVQTMIKAARE